MSKAQLEQAFILQQDNQIDAAISIFKAILLQDPLQPDALHGMGMAFAQLRDYTQAAQYLEQAVTVAPHVAEFHNNLANAYKALGKTEEALRHYRTALQLKTPYPQAHNNMGALFYRIGNFHEAAENFQKAIRMDPTSVDTHYNLANTYIQLDRLLDATAHFQEVLKLRPEHLGALHNLGITLSALKRFTEAQSLLEQVIVRDPHNTDALFHLGIIYSTIGQTAAAQQCYEKLLVINPEHAHAHHNLATLYLQLQEPQKALLHYQAALNIEPLNQTAQHMVAALSGKITPAGAPPEYTRALFDQYAYNYDQHVKTHLRYQVPYLLRNATTPYIHTLTAPLEVLDLGCGTGLCAPLFADIADKLYGVDISPNMIEVARQQGGYYKLYAMDAFSFLEKRNQAFDMIIAADVLVYFGALENIFTACHQALRSPGLFCFSVEKLTTPETPFTLLKSGRYAHTAEYIQHLAAKNNFVILTEQTHTIRYQEEHPVIGNIYILAKKGSL